MTTPRIKLTLIKSLNGRLQKHKDCARGLGLRRMHNPVWVLDTPEHRGMINKIAYLLRVEENV